MIQAQLQLLRSAVRWSDRVKRNNKLVSLEGDAVGDISKLIDDIRQHASGEAFKGGKATS